MNNDISQYQCHKVVNALQIDHVVHNPNGSKNLFFDEVDPVNVTREELQDRPIPEKGWYYVVYPSGYFSFSPQSVFEEGYTLVGSEDETGDNQ